MTGDFGTFSEILSSAKKRGRPPILSWDNIIPWSDIFSAEQLAYCEAIRVRGRNRGGRPPNRTRNRLLFEGYREAIRQGQTLRSSARTFFKQERGRDATPDDLRVVERQIARLRINKIGFD